MDSAVAVRETKQSEKSVVFAGVVMTRGNSVNPKDIQRDERPMQDIEGMPRESGSSPRCEKMKG